MKLPFLVSLSTFLGFTKPKEPTVSQIGIQARAIRHLIAYGQITVRDILNMGTNDGHKMIFRMRRMGLLHPLGHPKSDKLVRNRSGSGKHKVYFWTKKIPANWPDLTEDRRIKQRGGCK